MFCARLFICASWSPAGKGLTSWLSFVVSSVSLSLSHWYPGSGVVLDCIDSWSLQPYLLLKSLPVGKAVRPDGISDKILRELSVELSLSFYSLFNQSLQTGVFPHCWKISNVCSIPKSGNRSSISNYRPVSLVYTSEKVFERTVFKHIYNNFQDNNIFTPLWIHSRRLNC